MRYCTGPLQARACDANVHCSFRKRIPAREYMEISVLWDVFCAKLVGTYIEHIWRVLQCVLQCVLQHTEMSVS